jgi:hypothetical protein
MKAAIIIDSKILNIFRFDPSNVNLLERAGVIPCTLEEFEEVFLPQEPGMQMLAAGNWEDGKLAGWTVGRLTVTCEHADDGTVKITTLDGDIAEIVRTDYLNEHGALIKSSVKGWDGIEHTHAEVVYNDQGLISEYRAYNTNLKEIKVTENDAEVSKYVIEKQEGVDSSFFEYDELGRTIRQHTGHEGDEVDWTYADENAKLPNKIVYGVSGRTHEYDYDDKGNLTVLTEQLDQGNDIVDVSTMEFKNEYDSKGNIVSIMHKKHLILSLSSFWAKRNALATA